MVALCLDLNKEFDYEGYLFVPDAPEYTGQQFLTVSNLYTGRDASHTCKYIGIFPNGKYTTQSHWVHIPPDAMETWKDDNTIVFNKHTTAGRETQRILNRMRAHPPTTPAAQNRYAYQLGIFEKDDKKKEEKLGSCCGSTYRRFKERGHETLLHTCGVPVWTQYELGRMESVFEKYGIYQMDTIRRRTWENRIPR